MKKAGLIIVLFFCSCYLAAEDTVTEKEPASSGNRFVFNIEYRQSTGLIPSLDLLWHYNDTFFSSIYGNYYNESEKKKLTGFDESKYSVHAATLRAGADILGFYMMTSPLFLSLSFGGEYKRISREEFGYFVLDENYVIFQNDVKMDTFFPFLKFISGAKGTFCNNRFELSFFPSYFLHLSQDIFFRPLIKNGENISSSKWQKPAVEILNDLIIPISSSAILVRASFLAWSANYDLRVLEVNESEYYFGKKTVKQTFLEYSISANLILPFEISGGVKPFLGIGYSGLTSYSSGNKDSTDKYLFNFGVYY
jgi:hypothetical protein